MRACLIHWPSEFALYSKTGEGLISSQKSKNWLLSFFGRLTGV